MHSTVLRRSLLDRLVVISRKSHGLRSNKHRLFAHSVLPSPTKEDARVAVEMLSIHPWSSSHVCQTVESLASSNCLHMCMPHQLTRLHQLVSESPPNTTGTPARLDCLSALLPALAACPSLHTTAQEALHEIITGREALTPACERSILSVYASNIEKLVDVMKLARSCGHQFSRAYYRKALGKAMEQESGRPLPVARELLLMMTGDHSKEEVQADLLWVALHLARDPVQVKAIIQDIQTSCLPLDEGLSIQLMKTCLRTSVSLAQDHGHSNTNANPSQAVSALAACLVPQNATISAAAFERVLTACADTCQLTQAVVTFTCMTHTHRLAPTRAGLSSVGRLLCHPLLTANHVLRKLRLGVCYHTLSATVQAYGGQPPAWVYVECARPFTELLGLRGYQLMHDLCEAVLFKEHGEARGKVILNDLWSKEHYHQLISACQVNHTLELGTFLLQEMIKKGIAPDSNTVSLLLHFHGDKFNIGSYIIKIVQFMDGLSPEQMGQLQKPLYSALNKSLTHTMSERMREPLICDAVNQLLSVGSQSWSVEQCIRQLASYGRTSSGHNSTSLPNASCVASSVNYDTVLFRRATA